MAEGHSHFTQCVDCIFKQHVVTSIIPVVTISEKVIHLTARSKVVFPTDRLHGSCLAFAASWKGRSSTIAVVVVVACCACVRSGV